MAEIKYSAGYRPKMSIKTKLVMSFSLAVIIPLLLLAVANTYIFKDQTKKESLNKVKITLSGAKRIYYSQAKQLKNAFLVASFNPYLIKALSSDDVKFLGSLIKSYKNAFSFADYIGVTGRDGRILKSTNGVLGFKPELDGVIPESFRTGFPIVKTVVLDKKSLEKMGIKSAAGSSNMFVAAVVPIFVNGEPNGVIYGLISQSGNGYMPQEIYRQYHLNTAVFASLFNRQVCLSTLKIPGNIFGVGSRLPRYLFEKIGEGNDFIKELTYGGQTVFAAFHPIKDINGKVIGSMAVFISNRDYLTLFRKTAFFATLIIIFGLLISFIISYFASKDTLNPISAVSKAIKDFTSGDMDVTLDIKTNDEFEEIGEGFTEMATTVKDREDRMKKYNTFSDFLVGSLDFDKIISSTLDILEELLNLSSGIIYIYSRSGNIGFASDGRSNDIQPEIKAEIEETKNCDNELPENIEGYLIPWRFYGIRKFAATRLNASEGIAGHCLKERKTICFHDIPANAMILKDKLFEKGSSGMAMDYGFCEVFPKDIAWFPMYVGDTDIGVLMVSSIYGLKKEDIGFLEHAVKELSVALDNAKIHRKINELSITDELTGLYNRRKMDEVLESEFSKAKRYGNSLSVMIMDLDHFKRINDTYGHKTGDIVLSKVGRLLKDNIRNIDIATRYGGEEFVLVLPQVDFNNAVVVAKKIKKLVQGIKLAETDNEISVSIGIASLPDESIQTEEDMLKMADDFLYEAKNTGRNRIIGSYKGNKTVIAGNDANDVPPAE